MKEEAVDVGAARLAQLLMVEDIGRKHCASAIRKADPRCTAR